MEKDRKFYARYYIIRGQQALWKGGPAEHGSQYRNVVITSNQFNSTQGTFQVYALEGTGKGIQDGEFAGMVRRGKEVHAKLFEDADPYWADLVRLLQVFSYRRRRNKRAVADIRQKMAFPIYDTYIKRALDGIR